MFDLYVRELGDDLVPSECHQDDPCLSWTFNLSSKGHLFSSFLLLLKISILRLLVTSCSDGLCLQFRIFAKWHPTSKVA